jgi:hypothetical protein
MILKLAPYRADPIEALGCLRSAIVDQRDDVACEPSEFIALTNCRIPGTPKMSPLRLSISSRAAST